MIFYHLKPRCDRCDEPTDLETLSEDDWTGLLICEMCQAEAASWRDRMEPEMNPDR
jgi:hypothetical protein